MPCLYTYKSIRVNVNLSDHSVTLILGWKLELRIAKNALQKTHTCSEVQIQSNANQRREVKLTPKHTFTCAHAPTPAHPFTPMCAHAPMCMCKFAHSLLGFACPQGGPVASSVYKILPQNRLRIWIWIESYIQI